MVPISAAKAGSAASRRVGLWRIYSVTSNPCITNSYEPWFTWDVTILRGCFHSIHLDCIYKTRAPQWHLVNVLGGYGKPLCIEHFAPEASHPELLLATSGFLDCAEKPKNMGLGDLSDQASALDG